MVEIAQESARRHPSARLSSQPTTSTAAQQSVNDASQSRCLQVGVHAGRFELKNRPRMSSSVGGCGRVAPSTTADAPAMEPVSVVGRPASASSVGSRRSVSSPREVVDVHPAGAKGRRRASPGKAAGAHPSLCGPPNRAQRAPFRGLSIYRAIASDADNPALRRDLRHCDVAVRRPHDPPARGRPRPNFPTPPRCVLAPRPSRPRAHAETTPTRGDIGPGELPGTPET